MIHTNTAPSIGSRLASDRREATNWRAALPVLHAKGVTLRELRLSDAPSLLAFLSTDEVTRFISPPPTTIAGFERFIEWTHRERAAGHYVCFGIVPEGYDQAVGIFQVRQLNASFQTAEWGFAMGSNFWGSGIFIESARAVVAFTFATIGAERLEARSCIENGRGNGALQKLGATREGVLRQSFLRNGEYHDQVLWAIVGADWREWMGGQSHSNH
ncbi:MAG TPA: GNAT family protein [Vicinamibacterales bacterium]|nr:GNAT family protein [Vicinamibacterales bacterium]